jgi:hypothetical protein
MSTRQTLLVMCIIACAASIIFSLTVLGFVVGIIAGITCGSSILYDCLDNIKLFITRVYVTIRLMYILWPTTPMTTIWRITTTPI